MANGRGNRCGSPGGRGGGSPGGSGGGSPGGSGRGSPGGSGRGSRSIVPPKGSCARPRAGRCAACVKTTSNRPNIGTSVIPGKRRKDCCWYSQRWACPVDSSSSNFYLISYGILTSRPD